MKRYKAENFVGCLVGGGIGDALGYIVEFMNIDEIVGRFGKKGITDFSKLTGKAHISDDTQMTLFTANGILCAITAGRGDELAGYVYAAYIDWLRTQNQKKIPEMTRISWLLNVDALHATRAPGNTCISALSSGECGSVDHPINDSKGCGGIMRVAPIGLFMHSDKDVINCAAGAAALTHGNALGYIPAVTFALIINKIVTSDDELVDIVEYAVKNTLEAFPNEMETLKFINLIVKAIGLASENIDKELSIEEEAEIISQIGEGWVAEETLAIAVYCSLRYENNFEKAIQVAVNHSGDSDSTGALTGNILGALIGSDNLPMKYVTQMELYDVISEIANDLYEAATADSEDDFEFDDWNKKYLYHSYR